VFEEFPAEYWQGIFKTLQRILATFGQNTVELSRNAVFNFYWMKTIERLAAFAGQRRDFRDLVEAPEIRLNGQRLRGWSAIQDEVKERVASLAQNSTGQIVHGDLCFPNILFDPLSRLFKFIDPRGSFADTGIFGDARYDIAKLLHSLDGGYDFLIHEMFRIEIGGRDIALQQFFPESHRDVLRAFASVFGDRHDLQEVRLLEGLLFVSMCALHEEKPQRQIAMYATGLRILNSTLSHENLF
jgi:hypothetical protein